VPQKDLNLINEIKNEFKSSAFQFSFKIGTNFPDDPIAHEKNMLDLKKSRFEKNAFKVSYAFIR